jgi:RNA polymerase sigma factor (sigma-70 family)
MNNIETDVLIDSLRKEDKKVLLEIYTNYFPQVRHHIMSNAGNLLDAEDIFQDALVLIYLKIRDNSLVLTSSFGTYLNSVARFLWLKELERKRKYFGHTSKTADDIAADYDFHADYVKMEKRKLIHYHYSDLNQECRRVLDLYYKETPLSRITVLMGYSSDQYTKNRKSSCKERLVRAIWNNPRFKELKNESVPQDTKIPRW